MSRGHPEKPLDTGGLKEALRRISCEANLQPDATSAGAGDKKIREMSPGSRAGPPYSVERVTGEVEGKDEGGSPTRDRNDISPRSAGRGEMAAVSVKPPSVKTSVKVYQLLATQSEDRGDGEPHPPDRRISLQIAGHVETDARTDGSAVAARNTDGDVNATAISRKSSSPSGETAAVGPQRYLGDGANVTVRPIYPYCPYSPYGSPQGSPRNRRRPLRESRRVSIDNRQGAIQLNQYKLLDDIGQVRLKSLYERGKR